MLYSHNEQKKFGQDLVMNIIEIATDNIRKLAKYSVFRNRDEINRYKKEWIYCHLAIGLDILYSNVYLQTKGKDRELYESINYHASIRIEALFELMEENDDVLRLRYNEFVRRQKQYATIFDNITNGQKMIYETAYFSCELAGISRERIDIDFFVDDFAVDMISKFVIWMDQFIKERVYSR